MKKIFYIFFLLAGSQVVLLSQPMDNLSRINLLIDNSIDSLFIENKIESKAFSFHSPQNYVFLKNRVEHNFAKHGLITAVDSMASDIKYVIDYAGIEYSELFRDGLFGDFLLIRNAKLNGYYTIFDGDKLLGKKDFHLMSRDTVIYEQLNTYENPALPFTTAAPPTEPFVSGALEPIIAIGTVVISLLLFFTVRSK